MRRKEDYIRSYLESARHLGLDIEPLVQQVTKTAEAAFVADSYPVEPADEPAEKSPQRGDK